MDLLAWLCPWRDLITFFFFFSVRVMNKLLKLLQWIIHSLIIALTSSLSNIYLVYKSTPNISIISSYSVHSDWFCPVPPAMASPAVTWEFVITIFKEPFPLLKQNLHSSQLNVWFSPCLYQITLFFCCNTLLACYPDHSLSAICLLFYSSCSNSMCYLQTPSTRTLSSLSDHQQCSRV